VFFAIFFGIIDVVTAGDERKAYQYSYKTFPKNLDSIATLFDMEQQIKKGQNLYNTLIGEITTLVRKTPDDAYYKISDEGLVSHINNPSPVDITRVKNKELQELGVPGGEDTRSKLYDRFRNILINGYGELQQAQALQNQGRAKWFVNYSKAGPGTVQTPRSGTVDIRVKSFICKQCGYIFGPCNEEKEKELEDKITSGELINCKNEKCGDYLFTQFKASHTL
jgi:hypothetical protein